MAIDKMKALEFIERIAELSKDYNLSLGHEDEQGGFIIHVYCKENIDWLKQASVCREEFLCDGCEKEL